MGVSANWGVGSMLGGRDTAPEAVRSGAGAAILLLEGGVLQQPLGTVEPKVEGTERKWKMPSPW